MKSNRFTGFAKESTGEITGAKIGANTPHTDQKGKEKILELLKELHKVTENIPKNNVEQQKTFTKSFKKSTEESSKNNEEFQKWFHKTFKETSNIFKETIEKITDEDEKSG